MLYQVKLFAHSQKEEIQKEAFEKDFGNINLITEQKKKETMKMERKLENGGLKTLLECIRGRMD